MDTLTATIMVTRTEGIPTIWVTGTGTATEATIWVMGTAMETTTTMETTDTEATDTAALTHTLLQQPVHDRDLGRDQAQRVRRARRVAARLV